MEAYFFINISVSVIVLALLKYGNGTSNVDYYLSCFGIIVWFIPYTLIAQFIPTEVLIEPLIIKQSFLTYTKSLDISNTSVFNKEQAMQIAGLIALLVGLALFIKQAIRAITLNNQILNAPSLRFHKKLSHKHQVPVYSTSDIPSGMLLGIRSPRVVFSNAITESNQIKLIICHEKKHLERCDNIRLALLELIECLFWWNPLIRVLANKNRFFIEALCDETASKEFGVNEYINELASLILLNHHTKKYSLNSTATSSKRNNLSRIKLLKENREMTIRKKLTYTLALCTAILAMTWNTFAIATGNSSNSLDKELQGALVSFDLKVKDRTNKDEESVYASQMSMWVDFDKKVSFKIGDKFKFNITISDLGEKKDPLELAYFDMEIIETSGSNEKVVSNPRLKTAFTQEAMIEIDNFQVSPHAYAIKFTPERALKPK